MTRQILGLNRDAYYLIHDRIPRAIKSESIDSVRKIADIELSENVIMKIYDTDLILDLGARRVELEAQDFREIVIR
jgi:hypothetical protein